MRKFWLAIAILALSTTITFAQQARRVYITLDVSGSMNGSRYDLGNYSAQMIHSLCEPEDEVTLIIGGKPIALPYGASSLKIIQKPITSYNNIDPYATQFGDIVGFNHFYKPSDKKQDWLFIIGDGVWETESQKQYSADVKQFRTTVESGKLNVCFLQTHDNLDVKSDFLKYVEKMGIVDIYKVDQSRASIKEGCDYFARKILGFSNVNLDVKNSGSNKVIIVPELPLGGFQIVYQDDVNSNKLPSLQSASVDGETLAASLKGTPTTTPLRSSSPLSGRIWKVESNGVIPAGKEIILAFDKAVNIKNLSFFPIVDIGFSSIGVNASGSPLTQIESNVFCIGMKEKTAKVRIEVSSSSISSFPESLMKSSKVVVHANNKDYPAKYVKGGFEAEIDIINDETQYFAEIDCPGYFKKRTDIITLKRGDCDPEPEPELEPEHEFQVKKMKTLDFGHIAYEQLGNGKLTMWLYEEGTGEVLDPSKFHNDFQGSSFLYDVDHKIEGQNIILTIKPKGKWCECLFPMDIDMTLVSTPKAGAFDDVGKNYTKLEAPIHLVVDRRGWLPRCIWLIITLAGLLLLLIYLRSLIKKRRFKKNARITSIYYDYYGRKKEGGTRYLREEGFTAWFKRWFTPIDERVNLSLDKPRVNSFTVAAADSKEMVSIRKSYLSTSKMVLDGYDPEFEQDNDKSKYVNWADGDNIEVYKSKGGKEGVLTFVSGEEDDGALYRVFLSILSFIVILSILTLLFLMFRSI